MIGLLLDLDARNGGSLTVFKNGSLLGVAATVRSIQHLAAPPQQQQQQQQQHAALADRTRALVTGTLTARE